MSDLEFLSLVPLDSFFKAEPWPFSPPKDRVLDLEREFEYELADLEAEGWDLDAFLLDWNDLEFSFWKPLLFSRPWMISADFDFEY